MCLVDNDTSRRKGDVVRAGGGGGGVFKRKLVRFAGLRGD